MEKAHPEIVLLENELHVRNLLTEVFQARGRIVEPFPGLEGLESFLARMGSYAKILIAEINVPGVSNAWANRIRNILPELPILFLSSYPASSRMDRNGIDEKELVFLRSPFRILDLLHRVEALTAA